MSLWAARGVVILAIPCLLATACDRSTPTGLPRGHPVRPTSGTAPWHSEAPPESAAQLQISPTDGSTNADPTDGISVKVTQGTITHLTVRTTGDPVQGRFNAGHTAWHSRWTLDTAAQYRVGVAAVDSDGRTAIAKSTFQTITPSQSFATQIFEGYKKVYGVGMPVILEFSRPITNHEAVERSLQLWASKPVVGAWYWDGDQTLYFRPRDYWPPHTTVRFAGHLDGVEGAAGVYGVHTLTQTFEIGRSLIAVASTRSHHVRIYLDRKLLDDWPISTGKPGDDTPNGTYLTITKSNPEEMKGPGYDIQVPWSVRFTYSGDFMHDAFWSVGQQGFENVSHGCVNLSPAHAKRYYKLADPGDPVTIGGSSRGGVWDNGWTVWFLSWKQVVRGSALHEAVEVGPHGSTFADRSTVHASRARSPLGAPHPGNSARA